MVSVNFISPWPSLEKGDDIKWLVTEMGIEIGDARDWDCTRRCTVPVLCLRMYQVSSGINQMVNVNVLFPRPSLQ